MTFDDKYTVNWSADSRSEASQNMSIMILDSNFIVMSKPTAIRSKVATKNVRDQFWLSALHWSILQKHIHSIHSRSHLLLVNLIEPEISLEHTSFP